MSFTTRMTSCQRMLSSSTYPSHRVRQMSGRVCLVEALHPDLRAIRQWHLPTTKDSESQCQIRMLQPTCPKDRRQSHRATQWLPEVSP